MKDIINVIKKLACINRYSQAVLNKPESVLEHTGMCVMLSLIISRHLKYEGYNLPIEEVLTAAIIHDIEECMVGDIPSPTKYYNDKIKEQIKFVERDFAKYIMEDLIKLPDLYDDWYDAKSHSIVAFVDIFCVLIKFHDEIVCRGNKSLNDLVSDKLMLLLRSKLADMEVDYPESIIVTKLRKYVETMGAYL